MSSSPFARERTVAEAAAREAGALIRQHAGHLGAEAVRAKGTHDLVTVMDEEAQRLIIARLQEAFPNDAILAEEGADEAAPASVKGRRWIIDPIDGTTNFTHGVPPYAVSIGLQDGSDLVLGAVYDVPHDELFLAARGEGLTLNGGPAGVSTADTLDASLIATGVPFRDYRYVEGYLAAFERVMRGTRGIRRHGSAAMDLAWVACGRFDGFFEAGLSPWDVAAGVLLVREGGGRVAGLSAGADPVFSGGLVASNGRLHEALAEAVGPLREAYGAVTI
ncbi:MAG: inositol monophosphatase [Rhodothermaceae bacterium]|nr:inositol monophosphatase [Rhodothermaceae bacterium]